MTTAFDAIASRRNVREFDDRPVAAADLDRILEAGRRSPSAKNWQPWDFVVVTERPRLEALSHVWQGGRHVAQAAAAVALVLPDVEGRKASIAWFDLGQAAAAMQITATALGIGSGHSSIGDQDLARELLAVPADRTVALLLDFGYPAGRPLAPISKPDRRSFDDVVHRDRW
jgi:nitroreductase